jgi:vitamin B12 transporter
MSTCSNYSLSGRRRARLLGSTIAATLLISAYGSADAQDQSPPPAQTAPAQPGQSQSPPQTPSGEQPGQAAPALPPVTVVKPTPTRRPTAGRPQPTPGRQEAARPQPTPVRQEAARPRPAPARQQAARPQPATGGQSGAPGAGQPGTGGQPGIDNFGGSPAEDILVTSPTHIPTPISQLPNSVSVVTSQDIQRDQRETLPDALMNVPGLNVVQTGGPGGETDVFIRGTNPEHTKVLIDGIDMSNPSAGNGGFDFSQTLTFDLDRIEVLRGPQSGLYGSDAIGGVISMFTKTGEGPAKLTLQATAGSFGTFNQAGSLSGSEDRFHYYFSVQHWDTQGTPITPGYAIQPGAVRNNDSYENLSYSTHLSYDFSDVFSINAVARYTEAKLKSTGDSDDNFFAFLSAPPVPFPPSADAEQQTQVVHNTYSRAEAVYSMFDGRIKNYFGLAYTEAWTQFIEPQNGDVFPPGFGPSDFIGVRTKEDYRSVIEVAPGETFVVGGDYEQSKLYQDNPLGSNVVFAETADKGVYAQLLSKFYKNFFLESNVRFDDNASFGTAVTYRVAPAFIVPWTDTKLKASYGTGFKAPSLEDLYVNFPPTFFANPGLQPEKSVGYDYGFEQPLLYDRFRLGVTYYHNDIRNLIETCSLTAGLPFPTSTLCNVGLATTYGIESFAAWKVTDRLTLRVDYTTTTAVDDITRLLLVRRPRNKETYQAIWKPIDPLTLSLNVLHEGTWADLNRPGTVPNVLEPVPLVGGPYTTVNIAVNYKANDQATVFSRIDNLFNADYQDPIGFLRPGRAYYAGLRFTNF